MLKHPEVKSKLQNEIDGLPKDAGIKEVQTLEYLRCVIHETLRLYGAVSGGLPRVVPKGGRWFGDYFIPEGTIVTSQAYTLHRNAEIFIFPLR